MTVIEGILLISLLANAYCLRKITKAEADIEKLREELLLLEAPMEFWLE